MALKTLWLKMVTKGFVTITIVDSVWFFDGPSPKEFTETHFCQFLAEVAPPDRLCRATTLP